MPMPDQQRPISLNGTPGIGHQRFVGLPLKRSEQELLASLESKIQAGQKTFIEVGLALAEIRDSRLYRAQFKTFEEYCQGKWGWNSSRARQLIAAAEIAKTVTIVTLTNEGQARQLGKVSPDQRDEVLNLAGQNPTAKSIREAHESLNQSFELPAAGTPAGDYLASVERQIERDTAINNRHDKAAAAFNERHAAAIIVEALLIKITLTVKEAKRLGRWRDFDDPVRNIPNQIAKLKTICER